MKMKTNPYVESKVNKASNWRYSSSEFLMYSTIKWNKSLTKVINFS